MRLYFVMDIFYYFVILICLLQRGDILALLLILSFRGRTRRNLEDVVCRHVSGKAQYGMGLGCIKHHRGCREGLGSGWIKRH